MKPPYAHVSQTVLVVIAAAGAIWLSAFFLPGSAVQPVPLLPSIGSVAGKVVAVSERPHVQKKRAAAPRSTIAAPVFVRTAFVPPTTVQRAVQPRRAPRVVHRPHRAVRPHPASKPKRHAPVQPAVPASTAKSTSMSFFSAAPRGKAVGWHRKHAASGTPAVAAPPPGHGRSHGQQGHGHGDGHGHAPPAQPAPVPATTQAPPTAPPVAAGHDNGKHLGDGHDHGDNGHGPGGKK